MEWLPYLLLFLSLLMMIFCMKGHGHRYKHYEDTDITKLNNKIEYLQKENDMLRDEILFLVELTKKES